MADKPESFSVITDARSGASVDMSSRMRRYTITMAFRTACFLGILVVHGWPRWVLLGCAVFLPYIAVLFANQTSTRGSSSKKITPGAPQDAKQLTVGPDETVVSGEVIDDEPRRREPRPEPGADDAQRDRVA